VTTFCPTPAYVPSSLVTQRETRRIFGYLRGDP
jgi:hypothetical protein